MYTYNINNDIVELNITTRSNQLIKSILDLEDFKLIKDYSIYACYDRKMNRFYIQIYKDKVTTLLHRFIMNLSSKLLVDHINHNTLDNRRMNLRVVTDQENQQNRESCQKNNINKIRNVGFNNSNGKYKVRLKIKGKEIYIVSYTTLAEAEKVAIKARQEYRFLSERVE